MYPLYVLVTGDPVAATERSRGGFARLIRQTTGVGWGGPWLEVDCRKQERFESLERIAGLVVTGSSASVLSCEPWMQRTARYLRTAVERGVPVLGICFGHQLLAEALGGKVQNNPNGREIGTVEVELCEDDPLLDTSEGPFLANMSHVDSIARLPKGAQRLARTRIEPHAAVRFAERAWGVQFHPEFDGEVMRQYVRARRERIDAEGLDAIEIETNVRFAPRGASVLERFARQVGPTVARSSAQSRNSGDSV